MTIEEYEVHIGMRKPVTKEQKKAATKTDRHDALVRIASRLPFIMPVILSMASIFGVFGLFA